MPDPPAAHATTVDAADEAGRQAVTTELDDTVDDLTAAVVSSVNQSGPTGRALSPFESIHALVCETTVIAIRLLGTLDPNALTTAWEGLVRENPLLAVRIEFGPEGLHLGVDASAVTPPTPGVCTSPQVVVCALWPTAWPSDEILCVSGSFHRGQS